METFWLRFLISRYFVDKFRSENLLTLYMEYFQIIFVSYKANVLALKLNQTVRYTKKQIWMISDDVWIWVLIADILQIIILMIFDKDTLRIRWKQSLVLCWYLISFSQRVGPWSNGSGIWIPRPKFEPHRVSDHGWQP